MASSTPTRALTFVVYYLSLIGSLSLAASEPNKKVSLALYYESLCPYSANFIVNYLPNLIENEDLFSVVDLHICPWGNAKLKSNDTFVCQHGPYECLLNTIEACAIHVWPQFAVHFSFINCIESLVFDRKYLEWESCFGKLGLNDEPIGDCYASGFGKKLELQYGAETNALQPPHQYVPWVVVDGQPLYEDYENFISYICKAYNGTTVPKSCSEASRYTGRKGKPKWIVPVSYKESKMPALAGRFISALSLWMQRFNGIASV